MPDNPDATVTITAERIGDMWTLYCIPTGAHSNDDRVTLGMAPSGAGVAFPMAIVERFWEAQQDG